MADDFGKIRCGDNAGVADTLRLGEVAARQDDGVLFECRLAQCRQNSAHRTQLPAEGEFTVELAGREGLSGDLAGGGEQT